MRASATRRDSASSPAVEPASVRPIRSRREGSPSADAAWMLAWSDPRLRAAASAEARLDELQRQAAADLEAYRSRMPADAWRQGVERTLDRLLREHYGLPVLDPDAG